MPIKGYKQSNEHRNNIKESMIGIKHSKERCKNISESLIGKKKNEDIKRNMSLGKLKYYKTHKAPRFGAITLERTKKILSRRTLEFWKNPDNKKQRIQQILKGLFETRPTSLEQDMINICKKHNLPFIYTGDGSFLIGYKNPDFICENKKLCIEVANIFHHAEDYPEKRKEYFKKFGWDCLVFRTNKLNEQFVVEQVREKLWQ